ncbi:hypothetical protein L211DRAFT_860070 [Terfezia boudieri ATCC MYA-4762]|uniref:Superoxide dismutase [Mn], mitochondrial n=1 Tax=Terfezia boudieri ATCC MYA-4762 TaxID=1051890 RepID=A0A3N4M6L4_9PEZI|nr:hypothetical protein L211DRAFT_860070 [Terfezia boudieri ATCC MYA-4762]
MQFLQYFAVFTQIIYGSDNHLNVTGSQIAATSVDSETATILPVDIESKIGVDFDITATTEVPLATNSIIFDNIDKTTDYLKKFTLPSLPYAYNALEPYISKQIMELHHTRHHQAYVDNLNAALQGHATAFQKADVKKQIELQQVIKFNGGGHINHSLFWANLSPAGTPAASPSAAPQLRDAIEERWGSYDTFKEKFSKALLGIQGSGWGWLVKDKNKGILSIETTKDQDPVIGDRIPIIGVDMWEHAYYIQYLNDKASYVEGVWNIINWETAETRFKNLTSLYL